MITAITYSRNMVLHDTRLLGLPPINLASNIYNVGEKDTVTDIFKWVAKYSDNLLGTNGGKLVNLYIMCHGYYTLQGYADDKGQMSRPGAYLGGQGLQIGTNLSISNLSSLNPLKDMVGKIIVYACGAAGGELGAVDKNEEKAFPYASDHPLNPQYSSNNLRPFLNLGIDLAYDFEFMQGISDATNATVFGADKPQIYTGAVASGHIDFGEWQGNLYEFNPHSVHRKVHRAQNDYF
ncbi:MAG: hypothetical protein ABIX01_10550 [Chitinophagaceae bacterium]